MSSKMGKWFDALLLAALLPFVVGGCKTIAWPHINITKPVVIPPAVTVTTTTPSTTIPPAVVQPVPESKTIIETPYGSTLVYWGESNEARAQKAQFLRTMGATYIVTGLCFPGNKPAEALGADLSVWIFREDKVRLLDWGDWEHIFVYGDRPVNFDAINPGVKRWLRPDGSLYNVTRCVIGWHLDTYWTPAQCAAAIARVRQDFPLLAVGINLSPACANANEYTPLADFQMTDNGSIMPLDTH